MPIVTFDDKDILRSKIVTPDWYRVRIDASGQKPSKDGQSVNYTMEGTILFNAEDGDKKFTGVPLDWNFNSKAKGFMVGFFSALGAEVTSGARFNTDNAVGKELDIFVENEEYNGMMKNRVNHKYRAPKVD